MTVEDLTPQRGTSNPKPGTHQEGLSRFEVALVVARRAKQISDYFAATAPDAPGFPDTCGPVIEGYGGRKPLATAAAELGAGLLRVMRPEDEADSTKPEV